MDDLGAELIVRTYDEMQSDSVTTGLGCWIGLLEALGCPTEISKIGAPIEVKPCIHDVAADISSLDRSKIRERLENSELIQKMMRQSREIKKLVGDRKSVAGQMVGLLRCKHDGRRERVYDPAGEEVSVYQAVA